MERYDFRTQRLFVESEIRQGMRIELDRSQSNYLLNVLRLKQDAETLIFNGRDGEWLAKLIPLSRKSTALEVVSQIREQTPAYNLTYLYAPLKQARLDYMVQKAVEMGVGRLQPVFTHHTQVSRINIDRTKANVIEAAEQCGILNIAECREPIKLERLIDEWDSSIPIIYCDELASEEDTIEKLQAFKGKPLAVLIGPEGGFSQKERDLLHSKSFVVPISLGPRILRADTAAVAAMTLVQAVAGDW